MQSHCRQKRSNSLKWRLISKTRLLIFSMVIYRPTHAVPNKAVSVVSVWFPSEFSLQDVIHVDLQGSLKILFLKSIDQRPVIIILLSKKQLSEFKCTLQWLLIENILHKGRNKTCQLWVSQLCKTCEPLKNLT